MDATLACEFVTIKFKMRQFGTVPKRKWDRSCQKNDLVKFESEVYTDATLKLPVSWFLLSQS